MLHTQDSPRLALTFALGAALVLPMMDSVIKHLVLVYPVVMVVWIRLALMSVIIGAVAFRRHGVLLFLPSARGVQALRALLAVTATGLFYFSLRQLPLGESTAIMCLAVPFSIVLSYLLLNERATWQQCLAILISFFGAVLVLRPGGGLFSVAALLPLGGALAWAGFIICSRSAGHRDHPQVTTFWTSLGGCLMLAPFLPLFWVDGAEPRQITNFVVIGILGAAGQLLTAMAYRYGSAPLVAPVGYASIAVAVLIGWWRFGDQPDGIRLIGIALIAAGGVMVAFSRTMGRFTSSREPLEN